MDKAKVIYIERDDIYEGSHDDFPGLYFYGDSEQEAWANLTLGLATLDNLPNSDKDEAKAEGHLLHYAFALISKREGQRIQPKVWLAESFGRPTPFGSLTEMTRKQIRYTWSTLEAVWGLTREGVKAHHEQEKDAREATKRAA